MYLIALAVALGALLVFFTVSEDIWTVLAAATALVFSIWGFALAPWPVQLLLVSIVLGWERLYLLKERWLE